MVFKLCFNNVNFKSEKKLLSCIQYNVMYVYVSLSYTTEAVSCLNQECILQGWLVSN